MALTLTLYFPTVATISNALDLNSGSYELAANQETGPLWTPQGAPLSFVFSGGAPFTDMPLLLSTNTDIVTETIPLQITGADHNTVVSNVRALKRALSTASVHRTAILKVQPDNATNATFFEVYGGTVQLDPRFINKRGPQALLARIQLTITRRALATTPTMASIFSSQTFTNNPTAGSPCYRQMTVTLGDLIYKGQPMSIEITAASSDFTSSGVKTIWMGTLVQAPTTAAPAAAISTPSTSGVTAGSAMSATLSVTGNSAAAKHRIVALVGATVANLEMQAIVKASSSSGATLWESEWVRVPDGAYSTNGTYVDFGGFALPDALRTVPTSLTLSVQLYARATTGTATGTLRRIELLSYLTWTRIESSLALTSLPSVYGALDVSATEQANRLFQTPLVVFGSFADMPTPRGEPPKAVTSAYLYMSWQNGNLHTDAGTFTADVKCAPLYHDHRGNG